MLSLNSKHLNKAQSKASGSQGRSAFASVLDSASLAVESRPIQLQKSMHEQLKDKYSPQKRTSYAQTKTIDSARGSARSHVSIEAARSHAAMPLGTEVYKISTRGSEKDDGGDYGPTNGF